MVFSSAIFLFAFFLLTLAGYYLLDRRFKNALLLLMSLAFYAWGEPKFILILLLSILMNYLFARWVAGKDREKARLPLLLTVVFNLLVFFVFKYLNFTVSNLNHLAALFGHEGEWIPQTTIALPIGISFFTFQAMSYVFDVYRGNGEVQKNPLNVGLYITFFPQLIAGPIVRYQTVANEIRCRKETLADFTKGLGRFIIGLAKKTILSNTVAVLADYAFDGGHPLTVMLAWLGAIAYSLQIYFDFSGYSDMAIGLGLMFGFHFDENFDYPYSSGSVTEFWRRWHISLGTWFRDYVYFPLGGSRVKKKSRLIFNLFVVWFLTGFWHGANWTFILWGLLYFVLLVLEKTSGLLKALPEKRMLAVAWRIVTLVCIVLGWVLFRADSLRNAGYYILSMFGLKGAGFMDSNAGYMLHQYWLVLLLAAFLSLPFLKRFLSWLREKLNRPVLTEAVSDAVLLGLSITAIAFTVSNSYNPFIYFNF